MCVCVYVCVCRGASCFLAEDACGGDCREDDVLAGDEKREYGVVRFFGCEFRFALGLELVRLSVSRLCVFLGFFKSV